MIRHLQRQHPKLYAGFMKETKEEVQRPVFFERSSTIERYRHPPPNLEMIVSLASAARPHALACSCF
jgi:hypothetical protein